jgi:hypothetical protein
VHQTQSFSPWLCSPYAAPQPPLPSDRPWLDIKSTFSLLAAAERAATMDISRQNPFEIKDKTLLRLSENERKIVMALIECKRGRLMIWDNALTKCYIYRTSLTNLPHCAWSEAGSSPTSPSIAPLLLPQSSLILLFLSILLFLLCLETLPSIFLLLLLLSFI